MSKKSSAPARPATKPSTADTTAPPAIPPAVAALLEEIEKLLEEGNPKRALDVMSRARLNSPWLTNAAAVCQLRQGNYSVAMTSFRSLVIGTGGIMLRDDAPVVFKANFALSLLLVGNFDGATTLLTELRKEEHPAVLQLRTAFQQWKQNLSSWDRLKWNLAGLTPSTVTFDFPLGVLK